MASNTTKKKTAAGKKPAASKKGNSKSGSQKKTASRSKKAPVAVQQEFVIQEQRGEATNPMIMKEAVLWLVLAVCILIFISYIGFGGYVGEVITDISFGVFGLPAYLFPFLLFMASAFMISNKGSSIAGVKVASAAVFYLCIGSFAALFTKQYELTSGILELYERSAAYKTGGGVLGGSVCMFLCKALGALGTGIILFILMIVCMVLITQRSLIRGVKSQSTKMYRSAKESTERRREAHRLEMQQREEWRMFEEESEYMDPGVSRMPVRDRRVQEQNYQEQMRRNSRQRERQAVEQIRNMRNTNTAAAQQISQESPQLDIPIAFPVQKREQRMERRVSGVTMDTRIQGRTDHVGAEVHEIRPSRKMTVREMEERESFYIDLEASGDVHKSESDTVTVKKTEPVKNIMPDTESIVPEEMELCIEGMIADAQEMKQSDTDMHEILDAEGSSDEIDDALEEEANWQDANLTASSKKSVKSFDIFREAGSGAPSSAGTVFRDTKKAETESEKPAAVKKTIRTDAAEEGEVPVKKNPRSSEQEIAEGIASVEAEMAKAAEVVKPEYVYPPIDLLKKGKNTANGGQEQEIRKTAAKLQQTLNSFGVHVTVTNVSCGPSVTRYELMPEQGVKVSRIVALADDIKLNLAAADIRIEAPIPGKAAVGIEVPNKENSAVSLRELLESEEFQNHSSKLAFATGKDIGGKVVVSDIAKMPHLLVAGATGSGKSVCMNTIIMSILYKAHPDEVKLIMIDPKVVELSVYNGIPHLFIPVVTDPKKAAGALNWAVAEMTDRYNKFAEYGVRDLKGYNKKIEALDDVQDENKPKKLPQIVIIVDELADLMMVAPGEVEDAICRLAQLARACGIHLIIATQRPSVNVITGLIKANMPSRIAFSVSSGVDSRTIIDMNGAEKLLGKGDMLFYPQGYTKPARVQGAFVSDEEVADVVDFLKNKNTVAVYNAEMEEQIAKVQSAVMATRDAADTDELFAEAGRFIIEKDKASIGMMQRFFRIGFNRAARIMDQLSDAGVVGPEEGTKPRKILMSLEQFENYLEEN